MIVIFIHFWLIFCLDSRNIRFSQHEIHIAGAMREVMQQGKLQAVLCTDTLQKEHLFGMGPIENLRGEITILDGRVFTAMVMADTGIAVQQTEAVCAPFFGWAHIPGWREIQLPDSVISHRALERFLESASISEDQPFFFKLSGRMDDALIHVLNLPPGTEVKVPADARKGQLNRHIGGMEVDIVGFFSTKHQRVFTHHDSFLHLHLISKDRKLMGHLDELKFSAGGLKLFVPAS